MHIKFSKMHALGNDFVVLDDIQHPLPPNFTAADSIRRISCRKRGVGCDQVLLVGKPNATDADFNYRIFNADGGEIGQCGNGVRCVHAYVRRAGLATRDTLVWQTATVRMRTVWQDDGSVRADLPRPHLQSPIRAGGRDFLRLDIGNPHAICLTGREADDAELNQLGKQLNETLPDGVNVGFAAAENDGIHLRVYERGVGVTDACGSAALAAAVVAINEKLSPNPATVLMTGGALRCGVYDDGTTWQQGGATHVYDGVLDWRDDGTTS